MTKDFSFVKNSVGDQSPERTLMILTYELGKLIEYHLKAGIYGPTAYYSDANQRKEASDCISMLRYFCEQKGWNFEELATLGEEGYLERMEDIRKYATPEYIEENNR